MVGAGVGGAAGSAIGRDLNSGRKQTATGTATTAPPTPAKRYNEDHNYNGLPPRPQPWHSRASRWISTASPGSTGKGWAKGHAKKGC